MTFDHYQEMARKTAIYPYRGTIAGLTYAVLGLVGEAGEIAQKLKKLLRDKGGVSDADFEEAMAKELGDVLWYVAALASEIGYHLADVAGMNLQKLSSRQERGTLKGSGDER
jgi:NTP pyrophosphatase (non-canonical NTP hydrolase)